MCLDMGDHEGSIPSTCSESLEVWLFRLARAMMLRPIHPQRSNEDSRSRLRKRKQDTNMAMTLEEQIKALQAEKAALEAKNNTLAAKVAKAQTISFKIGEKRALSVYGLGRFPVTLYKQQWERLLDRSGDITAFLKENADKLAVKE
jgi:hypothetical protein